jgi:hypothetical protein
MTRRQRITPAQYRQRMREIRKYVAFDYDLRKPLSSAAKARINNYHAAIEKLTIRPHQVFRARNPDNLAAVQRFAQHDKRHPLIKVAFVPTDGKNKARVSVNRKGEVRAKIGYVRMFEIPFDMERLVEEGAEYVKEAIAAGPEVKRYVIQAGAFEVPSTSLPRDIVQDVQRHMSKYGSDKYDADNPNSHHFQNWLFGVNGYTFRNQDELTDYRHNKQTATIKKAKERAGYRKAQRTREANYYANDVTAELKRDWPPQPAPWRKVGEREYYRLQYKEGYTVISA